MTLDEVVEKFHIFGFEPEYTRYALAQGDSPFNAYEGLKMQLLACFEGLPPEAQNTLRTTYDALMALRMVNRVVGVFEEKKEKKPYKAPSIRTEDALAALTFEAFFTHMRECDGQRCKALAAVYDEMFALSVKNNTFPEGARPLLIRLGYLPVAKPEEETKL